MNPNVAALQGLIEECGKITSEKGFDVTNVPAQLLLMVTEISEALENIVPVDSLLSEHRSKLLGLCASIELERKLTEWNNGFSTIGTTENPMTRKDGILEELADVIIRVVSFVHGNKFTTDFMEILSKKIAFNSTREYMHGKKN